MLPRTWEKKLVDMNVEDLRDDHLRWADLVFLSAISVQTESVRRVIARCKSFGVRIVAGGPLFTTEYEAFGVVTAMVGLLNALPRTRLYERLNQEHRRWRLLFWCVFRRPRLFPQAITLAI
jgi:hypothetical protein